MFRRSIENELHDRIKQRTEHNNVVLVEGTRQVGKTTLIRHVLANSQTSHVAINLELDRIFCEKIDRCQTFSEFSDLLTVERGFRVNSDQILFVDEAQESLKLGAFVRFMKENWSGNLAILSGSNLNRLFRADHRYPVGRIDHMVIRPLGWNEFLLAMGQNDLFEMLRDPEKISPSVHEKLISHFDLYLKLGGLPEVILKYTQNSNWEETRENLLLGYNHDFRRIFGEDRAAYFAACLATTAQLLGSPFKNAQVSQRLDGGKNNIIIDALSQLESWHMILKSDQRGMSVEQSFHPKRYLFDHGLARILRESAWPSPLNTNAMSAALKTPVGGLLENIVAQTLVLTHPNQKLTGWKKSSSGSEIDFVIKPAEQLLPIEVKATEKIKKTHLTGVMDFMEIFSCTTGLVVSFAPYGVVKLQRGKTITNIPFYLLENHLGESVWV